VQWLMFPVGDPGTGGIQSHVKWCGPEHACHLHIGRTPIGNRYVALARPRCGGQVFGRIAQNWLTHGLVLACGRPCAHSTQICLWANEARGRCLVYAVMMMANAGRAVSCGESGLAGFSG
jgi:hypothetical protein